MVPLFFLLTVLLFLFLSVVVFPAFIFRRSFFFAGALQTGTSDDIFNMDQETISIYDEIEIEDMTFDEALQIYHYPCPCGDRFEVSIDDLREEQDIAVCPSCSLMIRVIYDVVCHYLFFFHRLLSVNVLIPLSGGSPKEHGERLKPRFR